MSECICPTLDLAMPDGRVEKIPYRLYQINATQQFSVIAIDFSSGVTLGDHAGVAYTPIGKLNEQNPIFEQQITNSLMREYWDFEKYPNPEIVLMDKTAVDDGDENEGPIQPLPTDKLFDTSPDAGHPDCICSRCGERIMKDEFALRLFTTNEEGEVAEDAKEYRYCEDCVVEANEEEAEPRTCRQCGCTETDPCIHQQYGPCWWVEDDLCSHCKNWPGESTRPASITL